VLLWLLLRRARPSSSCPRPDTSPADPLCRCWRTTGPPVAAVNIAAVDRRGRGGELLDSSACRSTCPCRSTSSRAHTFRCACAVAAEPRAAPARGGAPSEACPAPRTYPPRRRAGSPRAGRPGVLLSLRASSWAVVAMFRWWGRGDDFRDSYIRQSTAMKVREEMNERRRKEGIACNNLLASCQPHAKGSGAGAEGASAWSARLTATAAAAVSGLAVFQRAVLDSPATGENRRLQCGEAALSSANRPRIRALALSLDPAVPTA
jgi:hypothetical protein